MKKILIILFTFLNLLPTNSQNYNFLVGTYTNTGKSKGIYCYTINGKDLTYKTLSTTTGISNPSYLAFSTDKKSVYSVSESNEGSTAQAFTFNKKTKQLSFINTSATNGKGPCYISASKKHVFTANYGGGSISVFGRNKNGSLTEVLQVIKHEGKGINTERQNEPHVHQVLLSPDNKFVISNDLGTDHVTLYKYDKKATNQILTATDTLNVKPGSGPRHSIFNKKGDKIYLIQEIDGTVSVIDFNNSKLKLIQETTVVKNLEQVNRGADIHLSPDEKYLYITNRGTANDISCFKVDKKGMLEFVQQLPTGGDGPRNFAITPDGKLVLVAHQFTDNITIFRRDIETGLLTPTNNSIEVGAPVCLKFF